MARWVDTGVGTLHSLSPLTSAAWLSQWSLDLPSLSLAGAAAAAYLWGVHRVRSAGQAWPRSATRWFVVAGLGGWLVVTCSFLGTYARVLFWPLAVQDVLLLTLVPVGLTLGRPLALRQAARAAGPGDAVRRGSGLDALARVLSFPLTGSVIAVSLLLAVYTSGWDQARLEHPSLLLATRLLLLAAGCGFLWPLLGVDAGTGRTSYPVRALIALVDGLLDALPGLAVLGTGHVIAASWYDHVGRSWGPTPARAQQIGGTAMIAVSELVGLPALLVLLVAWVRSDAAQAAHVDAGLDAVSAAEQAAGGPGHASGPGDPSPVVLLHRPWWEVDAGPLADRAQRYGWTGHDPGPPVD